MSASHPYVSPVALPAPSIAVDSPEEVTPLASLLHPDVLDVAVRVVPQLDVLDASQFAKFARAAADIYPRHPELNGVVLAVLAALDAPAGAPCDSEGLHKKALSVLRMLTLSREGLTRARGSVRADQLVRRYLTCRQLTGTLSTRHARLAAYRALVRYTQDWIHACPSRSTLAHLGLPPYTARTSKTFGPGVAKRLVRARRRASVKVFSPKALEAYAKALGRADELRTLHAATAAAIAQLDRTSRTPVAYAVEYRGTTSHLRVWTRQAFVLAHPQGRVDRRVRERPDEAVVEFVRATDARGQPRPDPWFAELARAWIDDHARRALRTAVGINVEAYDAGTGGLVNPGRTLAQFASRAARYARTCGEPVPLLLDVDALYAGALVGRVLLYSAVAWGSRIHEIQQLRLDEPFLRGVETAGGVAPAAAILPKGRKSGLADFKDPTSSGWEVRLVCDDHMDAMLALEDHLVGLHGDLLVVTPDRPGLRRLTPGLYLFQMNGRLLSARALTASLRLLTHGVTIRVGERVIPLAVHVLRHEGATSMRTTGASMRDIKGLLSHQDLQSTAYYAGGGSLTLNEQRTLIELRMGTITGRVAFRARPREPNA